MSNSAKISIVTPSYNQGRFLERTIQSVLSQNYINIEYILIDGGSTDGSVDIIKKYSQSLAYWQSGPDQGQTDAIIKGMSMATGDILGYLNSDDVLLPGALEAMGETLDSDQEQWAIGWSRIIDDNDNELCSRPVYPFSLSELWHNEYLIPQECTYFTRRLYEKVGGFDASFHYAMDMHAWLKMCSLARPLLIPQYIGCYRVHESQKTSRMDRYFHEVKKAKLDVENWRIANSMPPKPGKPFLRGPAFKAAKACYYLTKGGTEMLHAIRRFQKNYRA